MKKLTIIGVLLCLTFSFCKAQNVEKVENTEILCLSSISKFTSYDFGSYTIKVFLKDNETGSLNKINGSEEISQNIIVIIKSGDIKPEINGFQVKNIYLNGALNVKTVNNYYEIEFKDEISNSLKKFKFNNQGKIL